MVGQRGHEDMRRMGLTGLDGLDSSVTALRFGPNDTVYVLTVDKLVVLDKPTVSTPTEYLIAMIQWTC